MKRFISIGVLLILLVAAFIWLTRRPATSSSIAVSPSPASTLTPDQLPGLRSGPPPWDAGLAQLEDRLRAIHLPPLAQEGTVLHTHQHLDIFIGDQPVVVPAHIGIDASAGFISHLHTHDDLQIIHVESPEVRQFTLGQFFDVWGVLFSDSCLGANCASASHQLLLYSNGQPVPPPFRDLPLTDHQQIALYFVPLTATPSSVPSTYNFPPGY